eukprot:CAMPEP_0198216226 /NCGR_PEP_ID=MMETSP1445-20131203/55992_1 /TAXON_ID=36898 /ORGANISM="Pyramimonas sp., Strain CCMP2087" /LENGTH=376 /DNA_ID=CAMNT_0043892365 /DNA_START=406 /DNA_END=1536 /DNA_ORIENTATION=-
MNPLLLSPLNASRGGVFPLLLSIITSHSQRSPNARTSFFGFFTVPTVYFPLLLLAIFLLLGGSVIETTAAVGIGYAEHYGYLAKTKPGFATFANLESSRLLRFFTSRRGYISTDTAGVSLPYANQQVEGNGTQQDLRSALQQLWSRTQTQTQSGGSTAEQRFPGRGHTAGGATSVVSQRGHFSQASATPSSQGGSSMDLPPASDSQSQSLEDTPGREARAAAFLRAHEQRMRQLGNATASTTFAASYEGIPTDLQSDFPPTSQRLPTGFPATTDFHNDYRLPDHWQPQAQDEGRHRIPASRLARDVPPPITAAVSAGSTPETPTAQAESLEQSDVDREDIDRLIEMGFTGSQAVRALRLTRGHLEAAAELLVSGNV